MRMETNAVGNACIVYINTSGNVMRFVQELDACFRQSETQT